MSGRTIVITGAGAPVGNACARRFAAAGDNLILADRNEDQLALIAEPLRSDDVQVNLVCADTFNRLHVHNIIAEALEAFGQLDVLVHASGTASQVDFFDMSEEDFDQTVNANLRSAFLINQAFARQLGKQHTTAEIKNGAIINLVAAEGGTAHAEQAVFASTQGGIVRLTQSVADVISLFGARANCVSVGTLMSDLKSDAERDLVRGETMLARAGEAEEVAETIFFLASQAAAYITAQTISVDGGRRMFRSEKSNTNG